MDFIYEKLKLKIIDKMESIGFVLDTGQQCLAFLKNGNFRDLCVGFWASEIRISISNSDAYFYLSIDADGEVYRIVLDKLDRLINDFENIRNGKGGYAKVKNFIKYEDDLILLFEDDNYDPKDRSLLLSYYSMNRGMIRSEE